MNNFQVVFINPCPECEENKDYYTNVLRRLCGELRLSFICGEEPDFPSNELPETLFKSHKLFFQLVLPNTLTNNESKTEEDSSDFCDKENWINLSEDANHDLKLKILLNKVQEFYITLNKDDKRQDKRQDKFSNGHWSENIAQQLHEIADKLPISGYLLNIHWLVCGHTECVNTSKHIPLFGALKRLQMWNNACITWFFDSEGELCNNPFYESWNEELVITLRNIQHITEPIVNTTTVWHGLLVTLEDQLNTKSLINNSDWHLSRVNNSASLQLSMTNSNRSLESENISKDKQDLLKDRITIIYELNQCDIPLWKIFPNRFTLCHKTLLNRVFEIEKLSNSCGEFIFEKKEIVLLASLESCHNVSFTNKTTTLENWIEFVKTGLNDIGNVQDGAKTIETFYLLLYPVEPGIFHVYFLRPEKSLDRCSASVSHGKPAAEVVDKLRKAVDSLPRLSVELFANRMKQFDDAYFQSFTEQLSIVKDKNQNEGKQYLSPTELWKIFMTSYTLTEKTHSLSNGLCSNEEEIVSSDDSVPRISDPVVHSDEVVWPERQWLKILDSICGLDASPFKSQFSLTVHLDANEMLKHFTKDGKPMKKELESLRRQIEKRNNSPSNQDIEKCRELAIGIDYCLDNNVPTSTQSFSPKLLPKHVKHETLSICNTPKTLAMARLQSMKRKVKSESVSEKNADEVTEMDDVQPSTSKLKEHVDVKEKKTKSNLKRPTAVTKKKHHTSNDRNIDSKKGGSTTDTKLLKKKKRRSYDVSETASSPGSNQNTTEKRSDRHKRRLARVVKRSLISYGVDPTVEYFETCSERLYYLCKSFLKDLTTSEGLNNEMKRLADSNVANVVEFEKRRQTPKHVENKS